MRKIIGIVLIIYILTLCGCSYKKADSMPPIETAPKVSETKSEPMLDIVTTDKLLYNMVKDIVKDKHFVTYMFKNRESEIGFHFSEDSLNNIAKKDLFIYTGSGFEPWANSFVDKLDKSSVGVINASRGVKLISYNKPIQYKDISIKDNPYYLLSIDNYKIALMNIKNAIEDKDAKNRDFYEKNFAASLKDIETYESDLGKIKGNLGKYNFIIMEENLNYFAKYSSLNLIEVKDSQNPKADLENKIKDSKNLVLLYSDSKITKDYEDLIKKYNISTLDLKICNGEERYEDVIKYNVENLRKFIASKNAVPAVSTQTSTAK